MANCGLRKDDVASRLLFRMPKDVKIWLEREAARNAASQNSEIIRCIRARMDEQQRKAG